MVTRGKKDGGLPEQITSDGERWRVKTMYEIHVRSLWWRTTVLGLHMRNGAGEGGSCKRIMMALQVIFLLRTHLDDMNKLVALDS